MTLPDALALAEQLVIDHAHGDETQDADVAQAFYVLAAEIRRREGTCEWTLDTDDDCGIWQPSCGGDLYEFTNEFGPIGNQWKGCPYCLKPVVEVRPEPEVEDADDRD